MTHSDLERTLEAKGRELMRKLLQAHLDLRSPGEAASPVRDAAGETQSRAQLHERQLETIFGTVTVARTGYGAEGKPSLHPLDGALNLPVEKYSHEVRRRVAIEGGEKRLRRRGADAGSAIRAHTFRNASSKSSWLVRRKISRTSMSSVRRTLEPRLIPGAFLC